MRYFRAFLRVGSLFLVCFAVTLSERLLILRPNLNPYTTESECFRMMDFGENGLWEMRCFAKEHGLDFAEVVTTTMICDHYQYDGLDMSPKELLAIQENLRAWQPDAYENCLEQYRAILETLTCFPVPKHAEQKAFVGYENSWRYERNYGGERTHEGTDLMAGNQPSGYYPIVSISDGVVENIGWLELGGWRIGIRSDSGVYVYYAHLASYAQEWQVGDEVNAGELLGFMGNSGYGPIGTTGQFPVHLHLGIYLRTKHFTQLSVNPYDMLRYLEKFLIQAVY